MKSRFRAALGCALATLVTLSAYAGLPAGVTTCKDRCAEAGLTKSKCDWICDGKVAQSTTDDDDDAIALSCYEKCRDEGTSHTFCQSSCRVPATNKLMQKSCYERCRKDSTHTFCEQTCKH